MFWQCYNGRPVWSILMISFYIHKILEHIQQVFDRLRESGLKVKPSKCSLCVQEVVYLGHTVSKAGISANPDEVATVKEWPVPKNVSEVWSFVGLASYYQKFIKDFSTVARPLTRLMEKNVAFRWDESCQEAFQALKSSLVTSPILAFPNFELPFILDCDASNSGIGYVLSREVEGKEHVIAYGSRPLTRPERNYCVTRREMLAVVVGIKYYKHYMSGKKFTVRTDHGSLTWLMKAKEPEGQVARWIETLSSYEFEIKHRPGRSHRNADALSRKPCSQCSRIGIQAVDVVLSFAQDQMDCPEFGPIYKAVKEKVSLSLQGPMTRFMHELVQQWDSLLIVNGVLVRTYDTGGYKVVVPPGKINEILSGIHDLAAGGGHLGIRKSM